MTLRVKHTGLILGLLSMMISFVFYGRLQGVYDLLLICGFLVSVVFFLVILVSKGTTKSKLIWTLVVVFAITVLRLTAPILIKSSYLIYLNGHNSELTAVNHILTNKTGEVHLINDKVTDKDNVLTQLEKDSLMKLRRGLDVYIISKSDNGIYYGLSGFLDVRAGITYWTVNKKPDVELRLLKGSWYY